MDSLSRISVVIFILFSVIYRILLPFGDEPDYEYRAGKLINDDHSFWSPYSIFGSLLENFDYFSYCQIDGGLFDLWSNIDSYSCIESTWQIIFRLILLLMVVGPLLYFIVSRELLCKFYKIFNKRDINIKSIKNRSLVLGLSLLATGMIYYLGVFAEEQFVLVLSLFIYLFWDIKVIVFILIFLIFNLDIGNGLVVLSYVLMSYCFMYLLKKKLKLTVLILKICLIIIALNIGYIFLSYIEGIPFVSDKAMAIYQKNESFNYRDKYPIILRPIITFMTGVFMTPSGVKVVLSYIIYAVLIAMSIPKLKKLYKENIFIKEIELSLTAITLILVFVFLFPDYSNAKYYMFLLPFIMDVFLKIYNPIKIMKFLIMNNLIILSHLFIYIFA